MIKCHLVQTPKDKQSLFNDFDSDNSTWVLADVQSRSFLQDQLLNKRPYLEGSSIIIANELWTELLFQSDPEYRLISEDLARSLIWEWVKPLGLSWAKTPASARRILQMLHHLSPVLAHKDAEELLQEWFDNNPESVFRWRHWFEVGRRVWTEFENRKWALTVWIPSIMVQPEMKRPIWPRRLILDLGVRVSPVEMQLIREMSHEQDIEVIVPKPEWVDGFATSCDPYRLIEDTADRNPRENTRTLIEFSSKPTYRRFSTHLAEVKDATSQIRQWLDAGVQPSKIAVVAPDIELYGSALKIYLQEEGVPIQKSLSNPMHSHPDIARWLSEVRIRLNRFSKRDLEVYLYNSEEDVHIPYDEFRRLFGRFYDVDDLQRWPELEKKLEIKPAARSTQAEFLSWSLKFIPRNADLDRVSALVAEFSRDGITDLSLTTEVWMGMLEDLAASLSLSSVAIDTEGIFLLSLGSAEWMPVSHVIFLNASENALRRFNDSPFGALEAGKLLKDLGLAVSSHEGQPAEFELCWLLDRPWAAAEFYFAGANFAGEALTPSRFWLLGAHAKTNWKNAVSPRESRLDELQNSRLNELGASRKWSKAKLKSLSETLQVDLGQAPLQAIQRPPQSLSASSIERYQVCPFAFAAQRVFRLNDEPCLDLDLDRMSRGRLMHRIFADLGIEPFRIDWTEEELLALIEKARVDEEIQFAEPQMWPPLQQAHLKLTRQFLRLEKDWRSRFPKLRTVATELPFECAWDMEEKNWVEFTGAPNQIRFSGRIDRIDSDGEGHYSLIDYKSTVNNLRHWTSWLENDQLQLAIYAELIEKGLTTLPDGRVESAVYYVCKAESRNKGFYLKEASENLFEFDSRVRNQISLEDRKNLLAGVHEKIGATIDHIRAGYFSPLPKKLSTCDECNWSRLCRAPHLN